MAHYLNIMSVSLESFRRFKAYAVFDGEKLAITHCLPITGSPSLWREALVEEIKDKAAKGFSVLVEDRTDTIAQYGTRFLFDDVEEGRTTLYHGLDWYFAMQGMGAIIIDDSIKGFAIKAGGENSMIERKQNDKGQIVYDVQWANFTGAHKAMLMCVVAAQMEPLSERFLRDMFSFDDIAKENEMDPMLPFRSITVDHDRKRFLEYEAQFKD